MSVEAWQQLRLLMYPVIVASGIGWSLGFWLRWRSSRCAGDRWAGRLGLAVTAFGALSLAGLFVARETGYGASTAPLVSLGVVGLAAVMLAGALRLLVGGWRSTDSGNGLNGSTDA